MVLGVEGGGKPADYPMDWWAVKYWCAAKLFTPTSPIHGICVAGHWEKVLEGVACKVLTSASRNAHLVGRREHWLQSCRSMFTLKSIPSHDGEGTFFVSENQWVRIAGNLDTLGKIFTVTIQSLLGGLRGVAQEFDVN